MAISKLSGHASRWYESWVKGTTYFSSRDVPFQELSDALQARFARCPEQEPREKLLDLRMTGSDLAKYCRDFA